MKPRVATSDAAAQLRKCGVVLLRDFIARGSLTMLQEASARCFAAIATEKSIPQHYRFNRFSHSVLLNALMDFGCRGPEDLVAPLSTPGLGQLFSQVMGFDWTCNMEQSWVRKKFAPLQPPSAEYHAQDWHQDGALGVRFPSQPGQVIPMTELLTCWIPLNACGTDSPGLEFIRNPQTQLVHFTELGDLALRQRFPAQEFWAPELEFGDALVFLNNILHRTYTLPEMKSNRTSIEYRIFPR